MKFEDEPKMQKESDEKTMLFRWRNNGDAKFERGHPTDLGVGDFLKQIRSRNCTKA